MQAPDDHFDIFLQPGETYFGDADTCIRTLLGSCVAVTFWHPKRRIGGMCHFLVPSRSSRRIDHLDGRYGDEALLMLIQEAIRRETNPNDYQIKIFGGGDMFPHLGATRKLDVGVRNFSSIQNLLNVLKLSVAAEHVGDAGHRNVIFEVWSGDVWVRHNRAEPLDTSLMGTG